MFASIQLRVLFLLPGLLPLHATQYSPRKRSPGFSSFILVPGLARSKERLWYFINPTASPSPLLLCPPTLRPPVSNELPPTLARLRTLLLLSISTGSSPPSPSTSATSPNALCKPLWMLVQLFQVPSLSQNLGISSLLLAPRSCTCQSVPGALQVVSNLSS